MTVTLDNGTVYQVQDNTELHNAVGGYLPGRLKSDRVTGPISENRNPKGRAGAPL